MKNQVDAKKFLPDLLNDFPNFVPPDSRSRVVNYSGIDGLKQVTVNSLKAKGELLLFEIENMGSFLNVGLSEEVRKGFIKNKIHVKELMNQSNQPAWTNVEEFVTKFWDCRYIDPSILKMDVELLIYNDVVAIYNYKDKNIFCVEIYNQKLANMQRQIFNFMWHYAQKLEVGKSGMTSL